MSIRKFKFKGHVTVLTRCWNYKSSDSYPVSVTGGRVHFDFQLFRVSQVDDESLLLIITVDEYSGYL